MGLETYTCRAIVIGGGVVGLAVARALAARLPDVWLVEAEARLGQGISSRNSEVIHAGIYYPQGSLKARLCIRGREQLYAYCQSRQVPFRRCGKFIVAASETQCDTLRAILQQGLANGVEDLAWLDQAGTLALEPALRAVAAISSPSTGILDVQQYVMCLEADLLDRGGQVLMRARAEQLDCVAQGIRVRLGGEQSCWLEAPLVINCAGLDATALLATGTAGHGSEWQRTWYAKGNYFSYQGQVPFQRLIYPIPEPGGLGIHLMLDQGGQARFGPDVDWVEERDYRVDAGGRERFASAIRRYWPTLDANRLQPAYAGIRPKLRPQGEAATDFILDTPAQHGTKGLYSLLGIESPGLTSSLALADTLVAEIDLLGDL
ncbi:MAG: NAD(P)/FAD-dependent oxidoreductase [Hahellaceae bacterium]|nr:NAD(P)/FAD-dependent oxidoreductase [Hahellaceae bacterium]